MKYIKRFNESYIDEEGKLRDMDNVEFDKLVDGLSDVISDYHLFDNMLILIIKSGEDKSEECPKEIEFEITYKKSSDSYVILRLLDEYQIGEYDIEGAITSIKYSYRDL